MIGGCELVIIQAERRRVMCELYINGPKKLPMFIGLGFRSKDAMWRWSRGENTPPNAPIEAAIFGLEDVYGDEYEHLALIRRAMRWTEAV